MMYQFFMSEDQGNTWQNFGCPNFTTLKELKSGSLLGLFRLSFITSGGHFLKTWKSDDSGRTWYGPVLAAVYGPEPDKSFRSLVCLHRSMVELDDGSILVTAYTRFKGDKKDRAVIYRSIDGGQSYHYWSTIGYDPTVESKAGINEPSMVLLNNGDLLCIMRTNAYLPLMQARSSDGGATFSIPEKVGMDGVDPEVIMLSNGSLAMSYGRPGVWMAFSGDGTGRNWTDRICLWPGCAVSDSMQYYRHYDKTKYDYYMNSVLECERSLCLERSCCYTALCEVSPGRIIAAYCAPEDPGDHTPLAYWNKEMIKDYFIWTAEICL